MFQENDIEEQWSEQWPFLDSDVDDVDLLMRKYKNTIEHRLYGHPVCGNC